MQTAIMTTDAKLLGTSLELQKGQVVQVTEATNLPADSTTKWYARPANGKWSDGIDHNEEDSIGVYVDDLSFWTEVEADRVAILFVCPDCGEQDYWPVTRLNDGTPICDCNADMLVGKSVTVMSPTRNCNTKL